MGAIKELAYREAELKLLANLLREADKRDDELLAQAVRKVIDDRLDEISGD